MVDIHKNSLARAKRLIALVLSLSLLMNNVGQATAITYDSSTSTYFDSVDDYGLSTGSDSIGLQFGGTLGQFLRYSRTIGRFVFSDDLDVQGTISGWSLRIMGSASISGTLALEGSTTLSGAALRGFGLSTDCDNGTTSKLLWDATTGRFSCGTDQTGGGSQTAGQGLSLNGTILSVNTTLTGSLAKYATLSGSVVYANRTLSSSGTLIVEGNTILGDSPSNTLTVNSLLGSSLLPTGSALYNIGSDTNSWSTGYFATVEATSLVHSAGNITASNIISTDGMELRVNADNGDSDAQVSFHNDDRIRAFQFNNTLEDFILEDTLRASGSLLVTGTVSGAKLYGIGLTDCQNATTSKLLWNATTGRFSCGTDTDTTTTYTAGQGLNLNGTSFRLNQTVTGAVVQALNSLASSGSLTWKGTGSSGSSLHIGGGTIQIATNGSAVFNENSQDRDYRFEGDTDANLLFLDASTDKVGIGTVAPKTKLEVMGVMSGITLYATKSFSGAGLTDCQNATTSKLLWNATTGRFSCGTDQTGGGSLTAGQGLSLNGTALSVNATLTGTLLRFLTVSGSTVFAKNVLSSSGTLAVEGDTNIGGETFMVDSSNLKVGIKTLLYSEDFQVNGSARIDGAIYAGPGGAGSELVLQSGIIDQYDFTLGGGGALMINPSGGNVGIGGAAKTTFDVKGTVSGSTLRSFGLVDCDTGATSKLLWDATTGRFSCGTDQTGGSSGGGMSYETASGIFLKRSGGTMTGSLKIQNGNTHSDTTTPLLTVLGTMSGKGLAISNGGFFRGGNGDVNGDGSQAPADLLAIINYLSGGGTTNLLTPAEYARADVNGDGRVDYFDYYMISNYSLMDASENAIAKYTSDSAWTLDLNGDFGIGTNAPEAKLDVVGTISGSALNINGEGLFSGNVGVSTNNAHSTFTSSGSFATRARVMTATGSINGHDNVIFASGSSMITVTLPTAVGIAGRQYTIKKTSATTDTNMRRVIVATTSSQTIDRVSNWKLLNRGQEVTVVSDGANWHTVGGTSTYGLNGGFVSMGTTMNQWYGAPADATALTTAVLTTTATIRVLPFVAQKVMTINGMSVSVQTTAASAEVRLALYNDSGRGYPDQLVVDAGTVTTTSTGQRSICPSGCTTVGASALPVTIQPGLYWIAINNNSIAHTLRGYAVANLNPVSGFPSAYTTLRNVGWQVANTYGAYPATFPTAATATTAAPLPVVTMRFQE